LKTPRLSAIELASLSLAALENAQGLLEDARLLLASGRSARAYSLAALALEEYAKHVMTLAAIGRVVSEPDYWSRFWRRFRDHSEKADLGKMMVSEWGLSFVYTDERLEADVRAALLGKTRALYVDWADDGLALPWEAVTTSQATELIQEVGQWIEVAQGIFAGASAERLARIGSSPDVVEWMAQWNQALGAEGDDWAARSQALLASWASRADRRSSGLRTPRPPDTPVQRRAGERKQ